MNYDSARLILGFFPSKAAPALMDLIRPLTSDVTSSSVHRRYAPLRLPGESLVLAIAARENVQAVFKKLRTYAGSGALFLIRAENPNPPALPPRDQLRARLGANERKFNAACRDLEDAIRLDHALTAAGEWLHENSYVVLTQAAEVRRSLPHEYPRWLDGVVSRPDFSRVSAIATELVSRSDCALTEAAIAAALRESPWLTMREMWAFPVMLRMALIEALAESAWSVNRSQQLREASYLWANRLAAAARRGEEEFAFILDRLEADPCAAEPHFAVCLAEQLQEEESALAPVERWMESRLNAPLADVVKAEHACEASQRLSTANAFGSLRLLSHLEFAKTFEAVSVVEAELRSDPGGIYARGDFETRDECRRVLAHVALHSGVEEIDVARRAVALAAESGAHVPYFFLAGGLERLESELRTRVPFGIRLVRAIRRHAAAVYLPAILGLSACFVALVLLIAREAGVHHALVAAMLGTLAWFPLTELAIQIVNVLVISLLPPRKLPKLDFSSGIPAENATLVVVPMLLVSTDAVRAELDKLEIRYLANRDANLAYALFSDFTDTAEASAPDDEALFHSARQGIENLNQRYGERFLLFHRERAWSHSEGRWIGRERKRGKLEELNAFLCGEGDAEILRAGRLQNPVRYVITLDVDTQLPPGTARRMIETIAHPLNRIELDPRTRVRRAGYAIIQPRVSVALPNATATRFTRIFANAAGTDPYCKAVSDAQQDLFAEAIFHGKAIYDVRAVRTALAGRFPAETLLSHDLIEGAHAGVGLASDIELFENLPHTYSSYSRREHRWIRGDWQIAPWIFSRVPDAAGRRAPNPLNTLNRWRIAENLRRSLSPSASLVLLLAGWLFSAAPGVWTLTIAFAAAIPAFAPLLDRWAGRVSGTSAGWDGAAGELGRAAVNLAFLPHQAWLSMDAIARAIHRSAISHRNMLEWETAESVSLAHRHLSATLRQLIIVAACALALLPLVYLRGAMIPAIGFIILWIASPGLLLWLNQAGTVRRRLHPKDLAYLRLHARRTWRYFDDLVGAEHNWLPPDNSQLALRVEVARRTSPTNIGLWLTSALAARDLGYLTPDELVARTSKTIETLARLERYEGHPLNWYDTSTLAPLVPRYISTVDSGNLLASLWVFDRGLHDAMHAPVLGSAALHGLADTLAAAGDLTRDASVSAAVHELRRLFHSPAEAHEAIGRLRLARAAAIFLAPRLRDDERSYWLKRLSREIDAWNETADRYLRWMETLACAPESFAFVLGDPGMRLRRRLLRTAPSLVALADGIAPLDALVALGAGGESDAVTAWIDQLSREYQQARANAAETVTACEKLAASACDYAAGIDMRFLYDPARKLFGVGYAVGASPEFTSHYDLLASECRLASLVAIAKGDVPVAHWTALGRTRDPARGGPILLSWSGTMFEYLMPRLFLPDFSDSLLDAASRQAVEKQIEYGRREGIPWGVSEAAYSALDIHQTYQYRAFGVPDLALKRDCEPDLVVAPYATMLALMVDPAAALANLKRLETFGAAGPMGLYESIDFSRAKDRAGDRGVVIYAYMAHHQGMSLAALDNMLHRDVMQQRLHGALRMRAFESLLYERVPVAAQREEVSERVAMVRRAHDSSHDVPAPEHAPPHQFPCAHLVGNGRYTTLLTRAGTGFSRWNGFDVTRWRSDVSLDRSGTYIYIRDPREGNAWTATHAPDSFHFSVDRAELVRRVAGIETVVDSTVAPEDDVEVRRLAVTNHSTRARELELTSYLELALAPHRADAAHPAFSRLFIETEYLRDGVLIARRRARSPGEPAIWAAHMLTGASGEIQFETDRARFLGRGRDPERPEALDRNLTGASGAVVDPVFSLRCRVKLEPRRRVDLGFLTMAASSRESLLAMIEKYRSREAIARAFEMAWIHGQLELRYLRIRAGSVQRFQEIAGRLFYPSPALRASAQRLARNRLGQSSLWAYGISGDLPLLAVTVSESRDLALVRELLLAHAWWRTAGLLADLVILNQETPSYDRPLRYQIEQQMNAHSAPWINASGGVFLRDWDAMPAEHRDLILAAASVVMSGSRGGIDQQLSFESEPARSPELVPSRTAYQQYSRPLPFLELPIFNGTGGFSSDGREYATYLANGAETPAPWVNVMANPSFGAMTGESGLGFTWSINSQSNRLTPWHNDPVGDPQSEAVYIRDEETGAVWTPTASPIRESEPYRARHGQGYTLFEHNSHGISQKLTVFVPPSKAVKFHALVLRNDSSQRRTLSVVYFVEWTLGSVREDQQLHIRTAFDEASGALTATQFWNGAGAGRVAFIASSPRARSWSGDRSSFFGGGSRANPDALRRTVLDRRTGAGLDPAGALQISVSLDPGEQAEITFWLGEAESIDAARVLVLNLDARASLDETRTFWDSLLGVLHVRTPSLSTDFLLNRWLLYQTLSCRFWGRSALYQSGGAFGFRDQLQDAMALVYSAPQLVRAHILLAASRQFPEGDVQHWWHPDSGLGVRTRCSDDLAWLPYVVAHYIGITGDRAILDQEVPFVEGPALGPAEQDRMFIPSISEKTATLREHCRLALEHAFRLGPHNLPLMGSGDWNDGMNLVGVEGRGESVWLAWFLCGAFQDFADIAEADDPALAAVLRERAAALANAVESCAWDGEWYVRAFFDDGSALGSHANEEARIDSIAQSWAVLSGRGRADRARVAMDSAERYLVDEENSLIRLFTPPFDSSHPHPGYIMGYPPGFRENGGQYTHAAVWLAMARARMSDGDAAVRLLHMLNPIERTRDSQSVAKYAGEPYAIAADVSSAPGRTGRAGWTWYTGSAAWMYRVWIEEILGFKLRGDILHIQPAIPRDWPGFSITYRYRSTTYEIEVGRDLDGDNVIRLVDDGETHKIRVKIAGMKPRISELATVVHRNGNDAHRTAAEPVKKV